MASEYSSYQRYVPTYQKSYYNPGVTSERDVFRRGYYATNPEDEPEFRGSPYVLQAKNDAKGNVKKFLASDEQQAVKWTTPVALTMESTASDVIDDKAVDTVDRYLNKVFIRHSGINPVEVVAFAHAKANDPATRGYAVGTLQAAYQLILGIDSPFREVEAEAAFAKILGDHPFSAIVIGTRLPDQKKSFVRTYLYSPDKEVRIGLAQYKTAWDSVLPIILVDPKNDHFNDSKCATNSTWHCQMNEAFKCFLKTLRVPSEENQAAIFPYFLHKKVSDATGVTDLKYHVVDACHPCPTELKLKTLKFSTVVDGATTDDSKALVQFLCEHAFLYFLCFLGDTSSGAKIDTAKIGGFNVCGYAPKKEAKLKTTATLKLRQVKDAYKDRINDTMVLLKEMLTQSFDTNKDEIKCLGVLACAIDDMHKHVDKLIEEVKALKQNTELCLLASLRSRYLVLTAKLSDFYVTLQQAIGGMNMQVSMTQAVAEGFCSLTTKVVPWYHNRSEELESLYKAVRLLHDKRDGCAPRILIPSPVIVRERLRFELMEQVPSAFKKDDVEPDEAALMKFMREHCDSPHTHTIRNYLSLKTSMDVQRKMADLDVTTGELCKAEADLCDLLEWASQRSIVSESAKVAVSHWAAHAFAQFRETLGQTDGMIVRRSLEKRKQNDKNLQRLCKNAIKSLQNSLELVSEMMLAVGINPIADEILARKDADVVKGLAALMALKDPSSFDESMLCSVAKAVRCGEAASGSALDLISGISTAFKKLPHGPLGRDPFLDACAYPYAQAAVLGAVDGQWYVPYFGPELQPGYWKLDSPTIPKL